jgi:1-phosphofructokinase
MGVGMKIVTFTLNPAIDLTVKLEKLTPGEVHRAETSFIRAGGKGINVSANLAGYGMDTTASGFLGSGNAETFERLFSSLGISDGFVRVEGENRTNIKILDGSGTTDVNLKGISVTEQDIEKLVSLADALFPDGKGIAVLSGSLPSNCPPDFYRTFIRKLEKLGCTVFLDADGEALENALSADVLPDCIKPNLKEFSEWAGRSLTNYRDIIDVARTLLNRGSKLVVVSMSGDGALYINPEQTIHAWGKPERIASTVGAGDAMMAGVVSAWNGESRGDQLEYLARISTAFSISWLENNAEAELSIKNRAWVREKIETAARKVVVKTIA